MSDVTNQARKTTKVGVVVSNAADKSVVVRVENFVMHPLYQRFIRTASKFMAHDEELGVASRTPSTSASFAPPPSSWRMTRKTAATPATGFSSRSAAPCRDESAGACARSSSGHSS